jgi:hypothetical protein
MSPNELFQAALQLEGSPWRVVQSEFGGQPPSLEIGFESDGALHTIAGSPFFTGNAPYGLAVDPTDSYLYVANFVDNTISGFSITKKGALKPVTGSPFAAGDGPFSVAIAP